MIGRRGRAAVAEGAVDPPLPAYAGGLQAVTDGKVLGWVWDPVTPEQRVAVTVIVDGEIVAHGVADVERKDLADQGVGDGACGFLVALPQSLRAPGRHRVSVLAGPEQAALTASPAFWQHEGPNGDWSDVVFEPGGGLSAPVPDPPRQEHQRALVGRDGWLFDAAEATPPEGPSDAYLRRLADYLAQTAATCASLGFDYLPAIAPAKRHVTAAAPSAERGWLERLRAQLRELDDVELLDLLPALVDAERHGACYHRSDPDWNDRGAFFAARALLKEGRKRVRTLLAPSPSDLRLRETAGHLGPLATAPKLALIGVELVPCEFLASAETGVALDPRQLKALRMPVSASLVGELHIRQYEHPECESDVRLALVGGEPCLALLPWLTESARRTSFFWSEQPPLQQLELELPHLVIHVLRESDLAGSRLDLEAPTP